MNFFDEANAFMKDKTPAALTPEDTVDLDIPAQRDKIISFLRAEYENATLVEIERALFQTAEQMEKPYNKVAFLKKIRIKLED